MHEVLHPYMFCPCLWLLVSPREATVIWTRLSSPLACPWVGELRLPPSGRGCDPLLLCPLLSYSDPSALLFFVVSRPSWLVPEPEVCAHPSVVGARQEGALCYSPYLLRKINGSSLLAEVAFCF